MKITLPGFDPATLVLTAETESKQVYSGHATRTGTKVTKAVLAEVVAAGVATVYIINAGKPVLQNSFTIH